MLFTFKSKFCNWSMVQIATFIFQERRLWKSYIWKYILWINYIGSKKQKRESTSKIIYINKSFYTSYYLHCWQCVHFYKDNAFISISIWRMKVEETQLKFLWIMRKESIKLWRRENSIWIKSNYKPVLISFLTQNLKDD